MELRNAVFVVLLVSLLSAGAMAASFNVTRSGAFPSSGFAVTDLLQTPDRIYPGDEVRLNFNVQEIDSAGASSVKVTVLAPFLTENSEFNLGDMAYQDSKSVVVSFVVPTETKAGTYYVYVYAASKEGAQAQVAEIPLTVNEQHLANALIVEVVSNGEIYPGNEIGIPLTISNFGGLDAEDVIVQMQTSSSNAFSPIGSDRIYAGKIAAGGSGKVTFKAGVSPAASPAFYPQAFIISYKIDKEAQPSINQTVSIKVSSKTSLLISSEVSFSGSSQAASATAAASAGPSLVVTVANVGDEAVRGVYVLATSSSYGFSGAPDKFIGTLNLDDSATLSISLSQRQALQQAGAAQQQPGAGSVHLKVSYKDSFNAEHIQELDVPIVSGANFGADSSANGGVSAGQRFGRRAPGLTFLGVEPLYWGMGIVAVLAAFFGFKWYKRRSRK